LIHLRPRVEVQPGFLAFFFQTSEYWRLFSEHGAGHAHPNCNAWKLAETPPPLPPLAEKRIVAQVVALLARVNACRQWLEVAIKKRLAAATVRAEKLTQAILAMVSRGELIPT